MARTHDSDATLSLGPLATPARPAVGVPDLGFAARYQLGARLAEGGLAIIYDAHDVVLDRKVAIKQLRDPDPGLTARFLREARLTSRLVHPGIVPIYDLGSDADGVLSYAMKWIAGRSLAHELAARPTLEARLALVPAVIAIAEAVAYAHSQRVIHRDLKPANVVVGAFGEIVVIDWGLARSLDEPDLPTGGGAAPAHPQLTGAGSVLGTPCYMPPEQARGEAVDTRADIYALGAILYQLVSGAAPYDVSGAHTADAGDPIWDRVAAGPPRPIAALVPAVPPELAAIIERAMARAAGDRYADAEALAQALAAFLTHDHSARLTAAALPRVVEVERAAAGPPDASAALTATADVARFGLEQALAAWPANPDARAALERLRRALFAAALRRGDHAAAAALAGELPPDDERRRAVAELGERSAAAAALIRDRDHRVGLRERTLVGAGFVLLLIGAFVQTVLAGASIGDPLPQRTLLVNGAVVIGAMGLVVFLARQRLFANDASSAATRTLVAAAVIAMCNRGIGYLTDVPSAHVLRVDLLILGTAMAAYGRLRIAALPLLAVGASLIWPATTRLDFNLGVLAAALTMLARWWRQGRWTS